MKFTYIVDWAYASSASARNFGFPAGCWVVVRQSLIGSEDVSAFEEDRLEEALSMGGAL